MFNPRSGGDAGGEWLVRAGSWNLEFGAVSLSPTIYANRSDRLNESQRSTLIAPIG